MASPYPLPSVHALAPLDPLLLQETIPQRRL